MLGWKKSIGNLFFKRREEGEEEEDDDDCLFQMRIAAWLVVWLLG
jgi:hypothetical protein